MKPTVRRLGRARRAVREWGARSKAPVRLLGGWARKAREGLSVLLELPVPVVLAVLWLVGVALLGAGALALYLCGSALARMLLGP